MSTSINLILKHWILGDHGCGQSSIAPSAPHKINDLHAIRSSKLNNIYLHIINIIMKIPDVTKLKGKKKTKEQI